MENDITDKKQIIIDLFNNNVKGKDIVYDNKHCGSEGHWLEKQMGLRHNSHNEPDLYGYEMKKYSSKITFGDFSASEYLFSKNKQMLIQINNWTDDEPKITRKEFIRHFGTPNAAKNDRYSWSGKCVPKYDIWNECGQRMLFDEEDNLCIVYSFEQDNRECKNTFPDYLRCGEVVIAIWKKEKLQKHIDKKFNSNGFFICHKNNGVYDKICFGRPFDFSHFVENIKAKNIIFDSGMYEGNYRNYSQFRSYSDRFWNNLITEEF